MQSASALEIWMNIFRPHFLCHDCDEIHCNISNISLYTEYHTEYHNAKKEPVYGSDKLLTWTIILSATHMVYTELSR